MARLPALATSLAVHAVAFAVVVLVPIFGNEPQPETDGQRPPVCTWPMSPTVVFADSRPAPVRRLATPRAASGGPSLPESPSTPPVAATLDPTTDATDSSAEIGELGPTGDINSGGGGSGVGYDQTGAGESGNGGGGTPLHVGGKIRQPTKLRYVKPDYPEIARHARITGEVVLECLIDVAGRVTNVRVVSGNPLLTPAAVSAVSEWLYSPTELNGLPVPVLLTVTIRFDLGR